MINDSARLDHHLPTDAALLVSGTKDILFLYTIKLLLHLYYGIKVVAPNEGFIFDQTDSCDILRERKRGKERRG